MLQESPTFESTCVFKRFQRLLFSDFSDPLRSRSHLLTWQTNYDLTFIQANKVVQFLVLSAKEIL